MTAVSAQTAHRRLKAQMGVCVHCKDPALLGKSMCHKHLQANNRASLKYKRKCVAEGMCWGCSAKRETEGMGVGAYHCPACLDYIEELKER